MATALAEPALGYDPLFEDALRGLTSTPKRLPSKYFYDELGSHLFELICDLPEYHVTRAELALTRAILPEIAAALPDDAILVEFGSGASVKTKLLLDAAPRISSYVPIDISRSAVEQAAAEIASEFPRLRVTPVVGDFTAGLELPLVAPAERRMGYFPGSTIGNFGPRAAGDFLAAARDLLGPGAGFILGADLVRDPRRLVPAYDDAAGVTAAFNLNLLRRLNAECDADFELDAFAHRAVWNEERSRVEMHLVSLERQVVDMGGIRVCFAAGETIHTENSYKYRPDELERLASGAGWHPVRRWTSPEPEFGVFLFEAR